MTDDPARVRSGQLRLPADRDPARRAIAAAHQPSGAYDRYMQLVRWKLVPGIY